MLKKLIGIGIATIILVLGIIVGINIRNIKANAGTTQPANEPHALVLNQHTNLLLPDLELAETHAALEQHLLSPNRQDTALTLKVLQVKLTPNDLTQPNAELKLLSLDS